MSKPYTSPTLYNEALQISITKLNKWEYLKPGQIKIGTLNWSRNGISTGSISIRANTQGEQPYIELDYKYGGEPRNYKVFLTSIHSNLNNGVIWYFICPKTNKRCRKLYSIGGYFLHREAFTGCMYECQTHSKKYRGFDKMLGVYFRIDQLFEQLNKKHFKKQYAGKPTKKYLKLSKQIEQAENIPLNDIERAMMV